MKLTPAQVRQVQRGEKTEHRVLIVDTHKVRRPPIQGRTGKVKRTGLSATYETQTRKPEVGDSLVIRPRVEPDPGRNTPGQPEVRIQITAVARERLGDVTTETANAMGYKTLSDFMHDWMSRHDHGYPPTTEALCTNCGGHKHYENHGGETVECDQCDEVGIVFVAIRPDTETIIERFEHKHAYHMVYALEFTHQADVSLWLHRRPGLPPTTSIGEALDPDAPLLGEPSKQWREKAEQRRVDAKLAGLDRAVDNLYDVIGQLADDAGVDVETFVRQINARVDRIRTKVARPIDERKAA